MIAAEKQRAALYAINGILIIARSLAEQGQSQELAKVLDDAEYLPMLMLESADRTEMFRIQLVGIAERYPDFRLALERFDAG